MAIQRRLCPVGGADSGLITQVSRCEGCEEAPKQQSGGILTPRPSSQQHRVTWVEVVSHALRMAGAKLKLQPQHARLFDTHAKGEPRQRIAHLYQTIRMRPAIFSKYVKDMDNIKPACAVIFRRCVLCSSRRVTREEGEYSSVRRPWTGLSSNGYGGVGGWKFDMSYDVLSLDTNHPLA
jgi:hypothetical protein